MKLSKCIHGLLELQKYFKEERQCDPKMFFYCDGKRIPVNEFCISADSISFFNHPDIKDEI